jgi:hypothetical protein
MHDAECATASHDLQLKKSVVKKLDTKLENLAKAIEKAKDPAMSETENKMTPAELEEEYITVYKEKCAQMILVDRVEATRHDAEWKRYVEAKRYEMLNAVRNRFMVDGSMENLRKGVSDSLTYIAQLRTMC